jgi:hypothetical protein
MRDERIRPETNPWWESDAAWGDIRRPVELLPLVPPTTIEPPPWAVRFAARNIVAGRNAVDVERALVRLGLTAGEAAASVDRWFDRRLGLANRMHHEQLRSQWLAALIALAVCFGVFLTFELLCFWSLAPTAVWRLPILGTLVLIALAVGGRLAMWCYRMHSNNDDGLLGPLP